MKNNIKQRDFRITNRHIITSTFVVKILKCLPTRHDAILHAKLKLNTYNRREDLKAEQMVTCTSNSFTPL